MVVSTFSPCPIRKKSTFRLIMAIPTIIEFTLIIKIVGVSSNGINVSKCAGHPVLRMSDKGSYTAQWGSLPPASSEVEERGLEDGLTASQKCSNRSSFGCSIHPEDHLECWKAYGSPRDGKWCWTGRETRNIAMFTKILTQTQNVVGGPRWGSVKPVGVAVR